MSTINLTVCGVAYPYPVQGEEPPWGAMVTAWAQAVTAGMLQKSGGTFTLTADVDFGGSYGLKAMKFATRTANPSQSGVARFANNEGMGWRNAANGGDLILKVNASDQLEFNGVAIGGAAAYAIDRAIVSNGSGLLTVAATTATEIGYVNGVTGAIQTQFNGKVPYTGATSDVDLGLFDLDVTDVRADGQISSGTVDTMTVNGGVITSNIQANSDTLAVIESHTHSNTAGNGAIFYHARSRGTTAAPAIVQNGDTLGIFAAVGYDGTDYAIGGWITWEVDNTPGANDMPCALVFSTTADGASTPTERMRIKSTGAVAVSGLTASRALATNASKELTSSATTDTQLGYLSTTTSDVQVQLDAKLATATAEASYARVLGRSSGLVTIGNTAVQTNTISVTVPGNSLSTDRRVVAQGKGYWSHDGTNTLTIGAEFGATSLFGGSIPTDAAGATSQPFRYEIEVRNNAATNAQVASLLVIFEDDDTAYQSALQTTDTAAEDTTTDKTFSVWLKWTTADPSETISVASDVTLS